MTKIPSNKMTNLEYYNNFLIGNCEYNKDLKWASDIAIDYLKKIAPKYKQSKKPAYVIFDIDDTIVFGDPAEVLGFKDMELGTIHKKNPDGTTLPNPIFVLIPNPSIVKIVKLAYELGFKVVVITARPPESELAAKYNLKLFEVPHHNLIMNIKDENPDFKIKARKDLEKMGDVVLTVGDMITDVFMPGNSLAIKLPDPDSKCSYVCYPA